MKTHIWSQLDYSNFAEKLEKYRKYAFFIRIQPNTSSQSVPIKMKQKATSINTRWLLNFVHSFKSAFLMTVCVQWIWTCEKRVTQFNHINSTEFSICRRNKWNSSLKYDIRYGVVFAVHCANATTEQWTQSTK